MKNLGIYLPFVLVVILIVILILLLSKNFGFGKGKNGDWLFGDGKNKDGDTDTEDNTDESDWPPVSLAELFDANELAGMGLHANSLDCTKGLFVGYSGPEVVVLQRWINDELRGYPNWPYPLLVEDGVFGSRTLQALYATFGGQDVNLKKLGISDC